MEVMEQATAMMRVSVQGVPNRTCTPTVIMPSSSEPPSPKRIKLEDHLDEDKDKILEEEEEEEDVEMLDETEEDHCSICLHSIADRTVIPPCSHDAFCFECILVWSEQSRRCPLCTQPIGDHLIHNIRSNWDYQKFFLPPLRSSVPPAPLAPILAAQSSNNNVRRRRVIRERQWGRRVREVDSRNEEDRLETALQRRRRIYELGLYAKHTASNSHTKYRPYPTPSHFASNPELIARATAFLRRELRVWVNLDVEFLTTFTISIMKSLDIRTEGAVRLLSEFLDMDERGHIDEERRTAQHFAHEVYSFMRSPYKDLFVYDTVAQYDTLPVLDPPRPPRTLKIQEPERPRSRIRHHSRSRSRPRSISYSPSGRYHERENHEPPDSHYISAENEASSSRRRKGKERERSHDRRTSSRRRRRRSPYYTSSSSEDHPLDGDTSTRLKGKSRETKRPRSASPARHDENNPRQLEVHSSESSSHAGNYRERSVTLSDRDLLPQKETTPPPPPPPPDPPQEVAPPLLIRAAVRAPKHKSLLESVQEHLKTTKPKTETIPTPNTKPVLVDRLTLEDGSLIASSSSITPMRADELETPPDPLALHEHSPIAPKEEAQVIQDLDKSVISSRSLLLRRLLEEKKRSNSMADPNMMENDLKRKIQERRKVSGSG